MNKTVHIILDYGHGCNCPGKCSPDKSFYEWKFTRDVGKEIAKRLHRSRDVDARPRAYDRPQKDLHQETTRQRSKLPLERGQSPLLPVRRKQLRLGIYPRKCGRRRRKMA